MSFGDPLVLLGLLAIRQGANVLELCCGDGFNSFHFYSIRAGKILAMDLDRDAIASARRNFAVDNIEFVAGDWRHGVDPAQVAEKLAGDREHRVKAVCVVHNETSTGVTTRIPEIRAAIDQAKHPALFMVDTISSLASIDYRHDEWGVDVTVAGSQKGLMLPPGLGFNAVSDKALAGCARRSRCCSTRRGSTRSSRAMPGMLRQRGAPSMAGASRCYASIRANIRIR